MKRDKQEKITSMGVKLAKSGLSLAILSAVSMPALAEFKADAYASLRASVESVSVDDAKAGEDDSFIGVRDAFSRFGVNASYDNIENFNLGATIEVPFNLANFEAEDPTFFDDNSIRVGKVTASGNWGSAWVGKGWLPYYNNVAWPVDLFSSFYSGWATYARFRENAIVYSTPRFYGLKLTAAKIQLDPSHDEGAHYVVSYSKGGFTAAYALEDMEDDAIGDTHGVALSYSTGPFYVAVKSEEYMPDNGDDQTISNIYASYTHGKYTFKGMYANGDDNHWAPGTSAHLGIDYQYNDSLKFFTEYFTEENSYAILKTDADSYDTLAPYGAESNGQAFMVGARYDI